MKGRADGRAAEQAIAQKARADAVEVARAEEKRRTDAQTVIANDAKQQRDTARADAVAAASAANGLRNRVAELVASARHPATSSGGATTGDALDLLADVLSRADETAGELADYADRARIAGQQCERSYDALIAAPPAN
nr:DUF2514 family protein [Paraburkholderia adhaesiva]